MCKINRRADLAIALVHKDRLACSQIRHVEESVFFYPHKWNMHPVYPKTVALLTIIRTLPCTIRSFSLQNVSISHEFFKALRALTNLESLALSNDLLSPKFVSNQSIIRLDLKSFSLFRCKVDSRLPALDTMESLSTFLNLDSIRILRTDDPYFLDAIVRRCKTLRVEKLHLHAMRLGNYSNYLAHMPYLLTLVIDYSNSQTHNYPTLDLSTVSMPKLQNLRCPAFIAQCIIRGRPLKNIDIYNWEQNMSWHSTLLLLHLIRKSPAPIIKLHVSARVYLKFSNEFWYTFPDLDELTLTLLSEWGKTHMSVRHSNSSAIQINNQFNLSVWVFAVCQTSICDSKRPIH
jgi:hypothetical protein